jgi:hypothetical protein
MGNAILVTNGNDDQGTATSTVPDQLFIAYYSTGSGPAQGLRFFEVEEERFQSHYQSVEYGAVIYGRFATNTVTLPYPMETTPRNDNDLASRVIFLGGISNPEIEVLTRAGTIFDPFFSLRSALVYNLEPTDLVNERRTNPLNFLGIVGVWFTIDGMMTHNIEDFGTTPNSRWAQSRGYARIYTKCIQLPGVDGIRDTPDDRILLSGGGSAGGETTSPSAEIFLTPGSSQLDGEEE